VKSIIIAIDGYSSCGKSTLARALARELHYIYIDSGAMYRAATLYFLRNNIPLTDSGAIREALSQIDIHFSPEADGHHTWLNGEDVEGEIRQMKVSQLVSQVAAISAVRRAMVAQQRILGAEKGIAMDGRDIGTVVFPGAELKIFLTAETEERIRRRYEQLRQQGQKPDREAIRQNLASRDQIDTTRADSPLRRAEDAVVVDNTNLSEAEQLIMLLALARHRINSRKPVKGF